MTAAFLSFTNSIKQQSWNFGRQYMHRCYTRNAVLIILCLGSALTSPPVVFSWWDYTVSFPLSLSLAADRTSVMRAPSLLPSFIEGFALHPCAIDWICYGCFPWSERESGAEKARNRNWISLKLSKGLFIDALTSIPQYNHNGRRPIRRDGRRLKAFLLITYDDALHELVLSSVVIWGWGVERKGSKRTVWVDVI